MPSRRAVLDIPEVFSYIRRQFRASVRDRIGVEAEWLTYERFASTRPSFAVLHGIATSTELPCGSAITLEPGGQIELSSHPFEDVDGVCDALERDASALLDRLALANITAASLGHDPRRDPQRIVSSPRYRAMESYFDSLGSAGRVMMSSTAALQINIDLGPDDGEAAARWQAAHALGPVLAGAFCNSAIVSGAPSGWRSARL
ncbi:MAG: glutamate-cysteine ligase family protein, partial [Actinomycetota bacterium]|nr:glutamate-cysteine ligase family protein [Actinomycetota bacterium]